MRNILLIFLAGLGFVTLESCKDDGFPVPPASIVPNFSVSISNDGFAPATATFTDLSIIPDRAGNISYRWNFGDGETSSEISPEHLYTNPGVFNVSLTLTSFTLSEAKTYSQVVVIIDADATGIPIFFTDGSAVFRALINENNPIALPIGISTLGDSYGMALDTVNNKLYITDYDGDKILIANPDGSNLQDFRTGVGGPDGIAIDYDNEMIYWDTDNGIRRADMNSTVLTQMEDFVTGQAAQDPEGVSIDHTTGYVFWNTYNAGVWKKHTNGSGQQEIIADPDGAGDAGGGGSSIVIGTRLFYDVYMASGDIHIKSANLDGSNVATVTTGVSRVVFGIAYDKVNNKIFWGDRTAEIIKRANLDGSGAESWLTGMSVRGIVIGKMEDEEE